MTKEQIAALIAAKIAGQGSMVDIGGALPEILTALAENGISTDMTVAEQMQARKDLGLYYEETRIGEKTAQWTNEPESETLHNYYKISDDTPTREQLIKVTNIHGNEVNASVAGTDDGFTVSFYNGSSILLFRIINAGSDNEHGIYCSAFGKAGFALYYNYPTTVISKVPEKFLPEQGGGSGASLVMSAFPEPGKIAKATFESSYCTLEELAKVCDGTYKSAMIHNGNFYNVFPAYGVQYEDDGDYDYEIYLVQGEKTYLLEFNKYSGIWDDYVYVTDKSELVHDATSLPTAQTTAATLKSRFKGVWTKKFLSFSEDGISLVPITIHHIDLDEETTALHCTFEWDGYKYDILDEETEGSDTYSCTITAAGGSAVYAEVTAVPAPGMSLSDFTAAGFTDAVLLGFANHTIAGFVINTELGSTVCPVSFVDKEYEEGSFSYLFTFFINGIQRKVYVQPSLNDFSVTELSNGPLNITGLPTAAMTTPADLAGIGLSSSAIRSAAYGERTGIKYNDYPNVYFIPIISAAEESDLYKISFAFGNNRYDCSVDTTQDTATVTVTPLS